MDGGEGGLGVNGVCWCEGDCNGCAVGRVFGVNGLRSWVAAV